MRKAMNRDDYLMRAHEFCKRGMDLPQTRLNPSDIQTIRDAVWKREDLRAHIKEELSNDALAMRLGVHRRTIEKVVSYQTARHIKDASVTFDDEPFVENKS